MIDSDIWARTPSILLPAVIHCSTQCKTLKHMAIHCLYCSPCRHAIDSDIWSKPPSDLLRHITTHCTTLQHTLQHICNTRRPLWQTTPEKVQNAQLIGICKYPCIYLNMYIEMATYCLITIQADKIDRPGTRCNTLQHTATHCNTLQHTATHCNTLQHTAAYCNTLQRTVIHCNILQHTAAHCNTLQHNMVSMQWWRHVWHNSLEGTSPLRIDLNKKNKK